MIFITFYSTLSSKLGPFCREYERAYRVIMLGPFCRPHDIAWVKTQERQLWENALSNIGAYAPTGIRTHDHLITSREHEPIHHSAPTVLCIHTPSMHTMHEHMIFSLLHGYDQLMKCIMSISTLSNIKTINYCNVQRSAESLYLMIVNRSIH